MKLNEDNFLIFAMNNYDRTICHSLVEFDEDIKKFLYLKKLLLRYVKDGDLRERMILNHIIILYNIFGTGALSLLFFKIDAECYPALITFLVYLQRMPSEVPDTSIRLLDYILDERILTSLEKL